MADHLKPIPAGAEQLASVQRYQKYCTTQLQSKLNGEGAQRQAEIPVTDILVLNRDKSDGQLELIYQNTKDNFFCGGLLDFNSHELAIRAGISETRTLQAKAHGEMTDACEVAKQLVGKSESGLKQCSDEAVSPELLKTSVQESPTIQYFKKYCSEKLNHHAKKLFAQEPALPFSLHRTQVLNSDNLDPYYALSFKSAGEDFSCEATIDPTSHLMTLKHGGYREDLSMMAGEMVALDDACTLTTHLIGAQKLVGDCHDKTPSERRWENIVNYAFHATVNVLAVMGMYKMGKKFLPGIKTRLVPGLPMVGNALLAGYLYDKATGLFLAADNPIRNYGYYGALATGALAPTLWRKAAATQTMKMLSARAISSGALGGLLSKMGSRSWGLRFLGVMALNYGVKWLAVDSDYDAWVNERVIDEVYEDNVYGWNMLNPLSWIRAGSRELAPDAMAWGVSRDHPGVKEKIMSKDREDSLLGKELYQQLVPRLLMDASAYDPKDPQAYHRIDFSIFEKPVALTNAEVLLQGFLSQGKDPEAVQQMFQLSPEQMDRMVQRVLLAQLQNTASFLKAVDQPVNQWAQDLFNADGTLKAGQGQEFLRKVFENATDGMGPEAEILVGRKLAVAQHYLRGTQVLDGHSVPELAQAAGLLKQNGQWAINGMTLTALSLLASEAYENSDPAAKQRLEGICQELQWRYLQAEPRERGVIAQALQSLGVDPDSVLAIEGAANDSCNASYEPSSDTKQKLATIKKKYIQGNLKR